MSDESVPAPVGLLSLLEQIFTGDTAPSGVKGQLAIGVRDGVHTTWLETSFGREVQTRRVETPDLEATAMLLMGADDARHIVATGELPDLPQLLHFHGDRAFLKRVITRYSGQKSFLSIRFADAAGE